MSDKCSCFDCSNCCEACENRIELTPFSIEQRSGLPALAYRVGTHARLKEAMKAKLGPKLPGLTTREDDDPTIALLDAGATMLDVLTFYQERIFNEGFLRTAIERNSILELARTIGYELNPGVAADAYLAFIVEDAPGAPGYAIIEKGTKVQSIPGPGEKPQTFETIEKIEARSEWNALKPKLSEWRPPQKDDDSVYLKGVNTGLKPGDGILFVGEERKGNANNENWDFRRVKTVKSDPINNRTKVTWDERLGHYNPPVDTAKKEPEVHAFRLRAALFGHNAPDWTAMPDSIKKAYLGKTENEAISKDEIENGWPHFTILKISGQNNATSPYAIHLDSSYPQIRPGSWLVLANPEYVELYEVENAMEDAGTNFTLSSKTTRVTLKGENLKEKFDKFVRETMVFAQSEKLDIAETPIHDDIQQGTKNIPLTQSVKGLEKGRALIVSGLVSSGNAVLERLVLEQVSEDGYSITLKDSLNNSYVRSSVTIYANVVHATHGETRNEILGSGDASQPFQKFTLKQTPLTYTSAATASGSLSTLEIRVNDILWKEVPSLYEQDGKAQVYATRISDDAKVTVQFGDGITGSRLPTGVENVIANYRIGIGLDAMKMVKSNQLSLLLTKPLGAKTVSNPIAPSGAENPETRDKARENAPFTMRTLDRIVSLKDYEDFSRQFSGIGKAKATWLWDGEKRFVHITVAAADSGEVKEATDLFNNLNDAIKTYGLPHQHFRIQSYTKLPFSMKANVQVKNQYIPDKVIAAVRSALENVFSFEKREFGQQVTASEVIALIQGIDGVKMVDLDFLKQGNNYGHVLPARTARWDRKTNTVNPAELLTIYPHGIELSNIKVKNA